MHGCIHSILKLKLCRHACQRRDQMILTCRYGKTCRPQHYSILHQRLAQVGVLYRDSEDRKSMWAEPTSMWAQT